MMTVDQSETEFPFRPWVRSTCRKAMIWGVGAVVLLGAVSWVMRAPGSAHVGRAFGVLGLYALLFMLTLLKIWWTAGRPAAILEADALAHQPVHRFTPRRIAYQDILASSPRAGTQSQRFLYRLKSGAVKEFFLNLGVIDGRHRFLDLLGERLVEAGLQPVQGARNSWRRPGFDDLTGERT